MISDYRRASSGTSISRATRRKSTTSTARRDSESTTIPRRFRRDIPKPWSVWRATRSRTWTRARWRASCGTISPRRRRARFRRACATPAARVRTAPCASAIRRRTWANVTRRRPNTSWRSPRVSVSTPNPERGPCAHRATPWRGTRRSGRRATGRRASAPHWCNQVRPSRGPRRRISCSRAPC